MDWSNERYVRFYVRDTKTWLKLRWEGQCLFMLILRKVDRAGILDDIDDPVDDLSLMTGLPVEHVKAGLERLLDREVIEINNNQLLIPNFMPAQETPRSDAQRQRESRERRRREASYYEQMREDKKRYEEENPEKVEAQKKLRAAVYGGKIKRLPCAVCGKKGKVDGHHEDYSKPLEVVWLCSKHHKGRHLEITKRDQESRVETFGHTSSRHGTLNPVPFPSLAEENIYALTNTKKKVDNHQEDDILLAIKGMGETTQKAIRQILQSWPECQIMHAVGIVTAVKNYMNQVDPGQVLTHAKEGWQADRDVYQGPSCKLHSYLVSYFRNAANNPRKNQEAEKPRPPSRSLMNYNLDDER